MKTIERKEGEYPLYNGHSHLFKKDETAYLADCFYFLTEEEAKDAWFRSLINSGGSYRAKPNNNLLEVVKVNFV